MTPSPPKALIEIDGQQAFSNLDQNTYATWPDRSNDSNRVEPIAMPGFAVNCKLQPGMRIFTIGSCFARNMEPKLKELGFDVPTSRIAEVGSVTPMVLNNFSAPSIFNEVSWALDPDSAYSPETHLYPVGNKFADLHLAGRWAYPTTRETALQRRDLIGGIYADLASAHALILTLGLLETWYDKSLGIYLNSAPMKSLIEAFPDRFSMRVLRHAEALDYLRRTLELVRAKCREDIQVFVTVSPVPLQSTFRADTDVITANAYSKATLRSVAEECVQDFEFAHYFPSYESVTLSDRAMTWHDDMIHVRPEIIDINIARMVAAHLDQPDGAVTDGGILLQRADKLFRAKQYTETLGLLDRLPNDTLREHRAIFLRLRALARLGRKDDAIAYVKQLLPEGGDVFDCLGVQCAVFYGRLLLAQSLLEDAEQVARACIAQNPGHMMTVILLGDIQLARRDLDAAIPTYLEALQLGKRVGLPYYKLAVAYRRKGDKVTALNMLDIAIAISPDDATFQSAKHKWTASGGT